jgi:hypothetical protein
MGILPTKSHPALLIQHIQISPWRHERSNLVKMRSKFGAGLESGLVARIARPYPHIEHPEGEEHHEQHDGAHHQGLAIVPPPLPLLPRLFAYYAVLVGGANGDLDLDETIEDCSYKLQCRSGSRTRKASIWAKVCYINDCDQTAPRAISGSPLHRNCVVGC